MHVIKTGQNNITLLLFLADLHSSPLFSLFGQSLLSKLMKWLGEDEFMKLVRTVMQNMPLLVKKDVHDQQLALFWPMTDRLVTAATHVRLLELAAALTSPASLSSQITTQKSNLTTALSNKVRRYEPVNNIIMFLSLKKVKNP